MPKFGAESLRQLETCHPDLQRLFQQVVKHWDCSVVEGKRSEAQQARNVAKGVSKTMASKHVFPADGPSLAADVAPYPVRWPVAPKDDSPAERTRWMKDYARFYYFAGYVLGVAAQMGIPLRHGAD